MENSPSQLIDARIKELDDWRGETLGRIRKLIKQADPEVVEEWKWRGVPVWSHAGIICTGETYKNAVKMTFAKGASLEDPSGLFNSSLGGSTRRAIDFREGAAIDGERERRVERDGGDFAAEQESAMVVSLLGGEIAQHIHTLMNDALGNGLALVQLPTRCGGARRERKQMQVAERKRADEGNSLVELGVGLAGEADHDVGAEGELGASGGDQRLNLLRVMPGAIAAMHAAQNSV